MNSTVASMALLLVLSQLPPAELSRVNAKGFDADIEGYSKFDENAGEDDYDCNYDPNDDFETVKPKNFPTDKPIKLLPETETDCSPPRQILEPSSDAPQSPRCLLRPKIPRLPDTSFNETPELDEDYPRDDQPEEPVPPLDYQFLENDDFPSGPDTFEEA